MVKYMKWCARCKLSLPMSAFAASTNRKRGGSYSRACQNAYSKEHYRRNASAHKKRRSVNRLGYISTNQRWMVEYLQGKGCVDCGEMDPIVLEFDHVSGTKVDDIGNMIRRGWGRHRIVAEVAKCVIRCANCHRRKTAYQFGWWRVKNGA